MKKKKYLAIFMAMSMAASTAPVTALADDAANTTGTESDTGAESGTTTGGTESGSTGETGGTTAPDTPAENEGVKSITELNAAITVAGETETTIKLAADITGDVVVPEGVNITIDLNGKKITNDGGHTITNNGTLTITDSSDEVGTVDNVTHAKGAIYNNGTLTILAGNFTRSREAGVDAGDNGGNSWYVILNHGTATMGVKDGDNSKIKVEANGKYSSLFENGWYENGQPGSVLTINGGTYVGGINTIKNDDYGELIINDGEFKNVAQAAFMNWNIATVNGGTFESDMYAILNEGYGKTSVDKGQLTITGGTFKSKTVAISKATYATHFGNATITGGEFITKDNAPIVDSAITLSDGDTFVVTGGVYTASDVQAYATDDYKAIKTTDGKYAVAKEISLDGVKRIRRGTTTTLKAIVEANGKTYEVADPITWASDKEAVATVADGVVTGVDYGSATITATLGGATEAPTEPTEPTEPTTPETPGESTDTAPQAEGDTTGDGAVTDGDSTTTTPTPLKASCTVTVFKKSFSGSSSSGGGGGSSAAKHGVTISDSKHGAVTASTAKAETGDKVILTPKADEGYALDKITAKDKDGKEVKLKAEKDGTYSFTMPKGGVTVDTTFKQAEGAASTDKPAAATKTIILQIGSTAVIVDDQAIINDVAPVIRNDRTLVPIRVITEALGGQVAWNEAAKEVTLTINGKEIKMTIGKALEKYGVAPVIIGDRTFVPVRFVADELGAVTTWDDATKTVTIQAVK